ncbi:MAG: FtsW/RodA/SpoVE family cell cycle protein [Chlamydiia bacterium]|nr:FtsW/RodA/SpoVE family cell cycle protein [Chlamydiia bacterium]
MWNPRAVTRLDFRVIPVIISLMIASCLVIAATDPVCTYSGGEVSFFTPKVQKQLQHFFLGWAVFIFFVGFNYHKLREWAWFLYVGMLLALVGLFFTEPIQNVRRWYRLPFVGASFQPSEYAKLIVVITLSWFLERNRSSAARLSTAFLGGVIVGIPFLLILKQPDLGTALVLCPVTLMMFYLGGIHSATVRWMTRLGFAALAFMLLIFMGILSHEKMHPFATKFLKDYQYERLNPHSHHGWAAQTAIGVGGLTGSGWRESEFTGRGWLPYGHTDSVFPAIGEEFGFFGLLFLLVLFYTLIYFGFQVMAAAVDDFGRMLSSGITVYLAMHIIINIGMMCGFLPITGVPLILVSYGGSSVFVTMAALGILQSIYAQRFMF